MKKILLTAILASLSVSTFGSSVTSDQHFTAIQNTETTDAFGLNTQTNRTEYRIETVRSICYRDVIVGYETICDRFAGSVNPDRRIPPGRGRHEPRPMPPICHNRPVYRMEAYSCWRSVSVPYEVFDHASTANVNVKISATPEGKPVSKICGVNFNLTGDYLLPTNTCAEYVAVANQTVEDHGYVKNYNYAIKLLDAEIVLAPLAGNLQGLQVNGSDLVVKTGNLNGTANFTLKLFVERKRLLKKDVVLINRPLNANEFSFQAIDARTGLVHVNLQKLLGNFESDKKNIIQVSLDVAINSPAHINNSAMPALHQEASITINK